VIKIPCGHTAQQYETIHIILNGGGSVLAYGAVGHAYSSEGGTLIAATAVSREANVTVDVEIGIATYSDFPTTTKISAFAPLVIARAQKAVGVLTTWTTAIPAMSLIQAKQINAKPANARVIDVVLVLEHI
jgi:hypothetical protein